MPCQGFKCQVQRSLCEKRLTGVTIWKKEPNTGGSWGKGCLETPRHCGASPSRQRRIWFVNSNMHMARGNASWTSTAGGVGVALPGGGSQMCNSIRPTPARQFNEWGRGRSPSSSAKIKLSKLWYIERDQLSFIVRATYDVLPSQSNWHSGLEEETACHFFASSTTL